jgi:hypothetical protein
MTIQRNYAPDTEAGVRVAEILYHLLLHSSEQQPRKEVRGMLHESNDGDETQIIPV